MAAPQVGQVIDGHRFKGGDPNDQASWESLTGPAYLSSIDPSVATQIKAMSEGRTPYPTAFALKTPYWQEMIKRVQQYDPDFDATKFQARVDTRKAFDKGPQGVNLTSIQTLIGHLDDLDQAGDALHSGPIPIFNAASNLIRPNIGDAQRQAALGKYETSRNAVASEAVRTLRGTAGTASDEKHWLDLFDPASPPAARKAATQQLVTLMADRLEPLRAQYRSAMGPKADPLTELYPRAAQAWARLNGQAGAGQPGAAQQPGPTAPGAAMPPPPQRRAGQVYPTPKGPMTWTGTGWLPQ